VAAILDISFHFQHQALQTCVDRFASVGDKCHIFNDSDLQHRAKHVRYFEDEAPSKLNLAPIALCKGYLVKDLEGSYRIYRVRQ